jgi:hypothetical protein
MKIEGSRLALGLFLEVIALCIIASFYFINFESLIMLLIFNFLFVSLIFQLNGTLNKKVGILALGNIIGLFWNFVLFCFSIAGTMYFGETFAAFYTFLYPLLNFLWIVSYWSLSLAALPNRKSANAEAKP